MYGSIPFMITRNLVRSPLTPSPPQILLGPEPILPECPFLPGRGFCGFVWKGDFQGSEL